MKETLALLLLIMWLVGVVLAKGAWLTALAVVIPFYSWYLVVERVMQMMGVH